MIFHDTKEWSKIWRKIDLQFGKWQDKFGKFSPEPIIVSKLEVWLNPIIQSGKCMSLKFTEQLCVKYLQQVGTTLALNRQLFCQKIDKKDTLWENKLLNMFFVDVAVKKLF